MRTLIGVLFDGVAYGSLLFLISLGLSVTMGLMNFVNLAHGAFAMMGGFLCVALMRRFGMSFGLTLPLVFVAIGAAGAVLEVALYRRLYRASALDQVLFTIGLTFMAGAAATWIWGPSQQPIELPPALHHQITVLGVDLGAYRLFLIGFVRRRSPRRWAWRSRARASARSCAPRSTTRRRRPAWASTSACSSASPSRSARGCRAWAARWRSTCSDWIRPSRSSTWSTSCWSWSSAARARSAAR